MKKYSNQQNNSLKHNYSSRHPQRISLIERIRTVAHEKLELDELRPAQEEAILAVLDGHDSLVVMPTGSGKSAIYQIAGLLLTGPTVVISPLIALQHDQMEAINEQEVAEAAAVNSTLPVSERREALAALEEGELDFVFLAPEQLKNEETMAHLRQARPTLFVIDEAHCISEWGHDFRPDYLRICNVIEELGHPVILALTATASPPVRQEIVQCLGMRRPRIMVHGFDRPNIRLSVERFESEDDKRNSLLDRVCEEVSAGRKPGIVYTATRQGAEEIAEELVQRGIRAAFYHAGVKSDERQSVQDAFMDGELEVMVATVAFGMGVDKPDVRFVFHLEISDSVDSYYQEIGRAGRDGEPARAILFYKQQDLGLRRFLTGGGQIAARQVERVVSALIEQDGFVHSDELLAKTELSQAKLKVALRRLEDAGVLETQPDGAVAVSDENVDPGELAEAAEQTQARYQQFVRSRLEMMQGYAEVHHCRREYLLNYFGEEFTAPCGHCDNCDQGAAPVVEEVSPRPFPQNSRVQHKAWGQGQVMRYEDDKMVVLFDEVGYKTLAVELVLESELLEQAA